MMVHLAENIRIAAILLKPYLPHGPKEIFKQLNMVDETLEEYDSIKTYGVSRLMEKSSINRSRSIRV